MCVCIYNRNHSETGIAMLGFLTLAALPSLREAAPTNEHVET